ncbi:MAG: epoxyqueuosine reductase QueH [Candidatus Omnitrophica bacterium]|nr:epoxyqueuosine reductase QueH [Candidatus Omnitrophota bacterium]
MKRKTILLHVCCAPCMIFPLEQLRVRNFEVGGFFYNPNIQPKEELLKRKTNVLAYSNRTDCAMFFDKNEDSEQFFAAFEGKLDGPERCHTCWYLRLKKTAEHAKKINVDYFSTTLLVSPYQDGEKIRDIGQKVAGETGVDFHYENFSSGYQRAVQISRLEDMYRQKYCGCNLSFEQSQAAKKKKNKT